MIQTFPPCHSDPITASTWPNWSDFGLLVIDRLIAHHGGSSSAPVPTDNGWLNDDLSNLDQAPLDLGRDALEIDMLPYEGANGENPDGPADEIAPPPVRLPLRESCAALRLAATFKTEAAFLTCLGRGQVTVVEGFAAEDLDAVALALMTGLPPPDWRLSIVVPDRSDRQAALLLKPELFEGDVTRHASKVFLRKLDEGLESTAGMIVLCPNGTTLPDDWRTGLPRPLQLAPLSTDLLIAQLRHSHPYCDLDEPAIRLALPTDRSLANVRYPLLRLAMREATAIEAAVRLSELTQTGQKDGIRLQDLVGYGPAKDIAVGIVDDLAAWARGDLDWSEISRGLLLSGPPGVGKTEFARAMARENGLTFVSGSYAAWQREGHLGDFLKAMNNSFMQAISGAPSVIFVDELDAFSSRGRDQNSHNGSYNSKAIAGLLEMLDGVSGREGVVVIAATNHVDHIDPALIRAGRFDQHIQIGLPSSADLAVILRQHLKSDLPDANLDRLAALALGRSGADVAAAVRSARGRARQNRRELEEDDLVAELCPTPAVKAPDLDWRAALHEAGHAVVITALSIGTPICLRLNNSGGECLTRMSLAPMTNSDFHRERMADLGGRAAERLVLGTVSSGAGGPLQSDLAKVTRSALREEVSFGLGGFGSLWLSHDPNPLDILRLPLAMQQRLSQRITDAENGAGDILRMNRDVLEDLAMALNRTRLVEGSVLQAFLSQVVLWPGDEPKPSKIDLNISVDRNVTVRDDLETKDGVIAEEEVPPLEG